MFVLYLPAFPSDFLRHVLLSLLPPNTISRVIREVGHWSPHRLLYSRVVQQLPGWLQLPKDQPKVGVPLPQFTRMSAAEAAAIRYHRGACIRMHCRDPLLFCRFMSLSPKANRETSPALAAAPIVSCLRAGGLRCQRTASAASPKRLRPRVAGQSQQDEQQ